ncbi:hypothetical protein LOTGIDRAFT_230701 [Lottia gigantea]|uniref:RUN domain-containing protein n=1 Tax=Lottia gigantea TaxID=225164 RepID=V4B1Y9_LOTGI|nr:hypothetical protein LOTGIDRAFT_230701 [Lottia gigantea]ESP01431.1 hypothetical protein LOTGIDRAFT_230701 [Lottia gigantea]
MSVTHPLLKILKANILELYTEERVIHDYNLNLAPFCRRLEDIFTLGLKNGNNWFGKPSYWAWINKLPQQRNPSFDHTVHFVKDCLKTSTVDGKGRLFLRAALVKKNLDIVIALVKENPVLLETWYERDSIIGNEILSEIFISLLEQVKTITFSLNLKNASYLDVTWDIPVYKDYEFVPCEALGIHFIEVEGHMIVLSVDKGSVAAEDGKVQPGDVLDEMFGESLKDVKRGRVQELFQHYKGIPVYVSIIKAREYSGNIYRPLRTALHELSIDPLKHQDEENSEETNGIDCVKPPHTILEEEETEMTPVHGPDGSASYKVTYIGEYSLGSDGRVERIEDGVLKVLQSNNRKNLSVMIYLSETGIKVRSLSGDEEILNHSYTEVSACGRRTDYLQHFSYIAGETSCNLSKDFVCHVFHASSQELTKVILCAIANIQCCCRLQLFAILRLENVPGGQHT